VLATQKIVCLSAVVRYRNQTARNGQRWERKNPIIHPLVPGTGCTQPARSMKVRNETQQSTKLPILEFRSPDQNKTEQVGEGLFGFHSPHPFHHTRCWVHEPVSATSDHNDDVSNGPYKCTGPLTRPSWMKRRLLQFSL
jgi:hypothetical protein